MHVFGLQFGILGATLLVGALVTDGMAGDVAPGVTRSSESISLWPPRLGGPEDPEGERMLKSMRRGLRYGNWLLQVRSVPGSADGVFWEIRAKPLEVDPTERWSTSDIDYEAYAKQVPVIRAPEHLWKRWTSPSMHEVVGIHFHDLQQSDAARVLYTQYAHPASGPDKGKGSRIEGTLMLPVTWWLDQTIVIRGDMTQSRVRSRVEHEVGHAANALRDFVETIRGEQTWDSAKLEGHRSRVVWRWRTEIMARPWDELFDRRRLVMTLRTYIDVLPPTRWSKLLNKPVDRLTDQDTLAFDNEHILIGDKYAAYRKRSAAAYHHKVGGMEAPVDKAPNFFPGKRR